MSSILVSHPCSGSLRILDHQVQGRYGNVPYFGCSGADSSSKKLISFQGQYLFNSCSWSARKYKSISSSLLDGGTNPDDSEDGSDKDESSERETEAVKNDMVRENLERLVGKDDSAFSGIDLATLIRNKYGRSYDVQLIKKEFMGRNLLALNVMWKYMEQRSFPLTEEEYILRLDDVANTLKCWGAVSHIRNSLAKSKERPRIGKAVSIFIDMDESGGRANEWIYK